MAISKNRRRNEEDDDAATPNLPDDVLERIVVRLPVESIIRCKLLSKHWNRTISCPRFIKMHGNLSSSRTHLLVWERLRYSLNLPKFDEQKLEFEASQEGPFQNVDVLCSSKGLILLILTSYRFCPDTRLALWNPFIRKYRSIRCIHGKEDRPKQHCFYRYHGLCYDSINDDYKVVGVLPRSMYSVFSCKHGKWSPKREFPKNIELFDNGFYFDGACYWLCNDNSDDTPPLRIQRSYRIVYYETRDDKIHTLDPPKSREYSWASLTSFRGGLCLYFYKFGTRKIDFLLLRRNDDSTLSWKALLTIKGESSYWSSRNISMRLCPINNNTIMIISAHYLHKYLIYDTSKEKIVLDSEEQGSQDQKIKWYVPLEESMDFPIPHVLPDARSMSRAW